VNLGEGGDTDYVIGCLFQDFDCRQHDSLLLLQECFLVLGESCYVDYCAPMLDINKRVICSVLTSLVSLSSWCTR
jgi:hypothetical protein